MTRLSKYMLWTLGLWLVLPSVSFIVISLALDKPGPAGALLGLWAALFFGGVGGLTFARMSGSDVFESVLFGGLAGLFIGAAPIAITFL